MGDNKAAVERFASAMDSLVLLGESMQQASSLLADEDGSDAPKASTSFLSVVALGSVSAGKSAVLNSLIGHPVLPTGENGATRAPIILDMERDKSSSSRGLAVVLEGRTQNVSASDVRHSLQGRLKNASSSKGRTEGIRLTLRSASTPPLKLIDLPGVSGSIDDSPAHDLAANNDTILLIVIPATSCRDVAASKALKLAQELDSDGTRTVGVISKVDQAASDPRSLAAVNALISGQGPPSTADIPWVALIGQSVSIAAAHSSGEDSLDTAWKAEMESLKSILNGAPSAKLGRIALVETLSHQIRTRLKQRLPNLLSGLQGKSQLVEQELARLGEQRVQTSEGTRAIALELCREFEDTFLQHINTGEGQGWKVVSSFEGVLPKRIKSLPLDQMFEISSIKKLVLEADGYQPYLLSPEKGLRALVRKALELAKDPSKACVDEVHRILVDIVSAAANGTAGLGRYPPLKREIVAIASSALDEYRVEAKKMVVALVDMERAFIPPQHFIRLVQRRMDRLRREDDGKGRQVKKAQDAEQSLLSKATAPTNVGGKLKDMKAQPEDVKKEGTDAPSTLQIVGDNAAGYLLKLSDKNDWAKRWFVLNEKTCKLAYTKKPEERNFRGVINLDECILEDGPENKENGADDPNAKGAKAKKANGTAEKEDPTASLIFRVSHKVAYKTVLKASHSLVVKAENIAEKLDWMSRIRACIEAKGGSGEDSVRSSKDSVSSSKDSDSSVIARSTYDGPADSSVLRRPIDPEEDLRLMAQEVRDYVEAVLNSLSANVPKAVVLCQVERAKEAMLNQLYSSISAHATGRIEELLQEDQEVKSRREKCQKQAAALSKLTKQLSLQEARSAAVSGFGDSSADSKPGGGMPESEDWRVAFEEAGARSSFSNSPSRSSRDARAPSPSLSGRASRNGDDENGDVGSSRRTPVRRAPPPPPGSTYRY
ncbi:hypothetical protein M758_11G017100 [Ceratodon purpureus]|uniref:dynamin GTPase n=1 Tax=Ceratodon purpureus TaxID=3225 RepID=A0A8T0GBA8_CERPU|nr:hypothetical protein KC19_11G018700 [Ceratodon purpureus]KAG0600222.1 hypothetical protein M758_11G017100 [Ceratodon purpureus]